MPGGRANFCLSKLAHAPTTSTGCGATRRFFSNSGVAKLGYRRVAGTPALGSMGMALLANSERGLPTLH